MHAGKMVFAQLMEFVVEYEFRKCVERYGGNHRVRNFTCWDQFLCMAFAQLTYRESLRDIEVCLRTKGKKLYHLGIRGTVARTTLARANDRRDWRIYQDFATSLIQQAQDLYSNDTLSVRLKRAAYALDSTTIDLCLTLFPWAKFRTTKAAVKLHTLLDLRGNIPSVIVISRGNMHDVNILDELDFEAGAIYIMDRAYLDYARLYRITKASAFFVTRAKKNTKFRRIYSHDVNRTTGIIADQTIMLTGVTSCNDYPERLRRIVFRDPVTDRRLVFLTNNFSLAPKTIAELYKSRWQIELFFKWIKQHLRIKAFFGTSENAVRTQIWIAVSVYVLVAIVKKRLNLEHSLHTMLQILSLSTFEKTPIFQLFCDFHTPEEDSGSANQLKLF
jgi:IS4 transposase